MRLGARLAGAALALLLAPSARAVPLTTDESLALTILLQPRLDLTPRDEGGVVDPIVDRAWLGVEGRPAERLAFRLAAGADDLGLGGDWSPHLALHEAWAEWIAGERLQLDAGLLPPPWAARDLLLEGGRVGIDNHEPPVAAPGGGAGRDIGLQVRGRLFHRRLEYRLAGLAGVEYGQGLQDTDYDGDGAPDAAPLSPDDLPRVTARLAWSFFEPLGGPGPGGLRPRGVILEERDGALVATRKVLTAGIAIDHQQDALYVEQRDQTGAVVSARRADWTALTGDLFADLPLADGRRSLHALVAGFWYPLDEGHPDAGQGVLAEAGFRLGRWEPLGAYELHDAGAGDAKDWVCGRLGLAVWLPRRTALRVEAGAWREGGGQAMSPVGQLQVELEF